MSNLIEAIARAISPSAFDEDLGSFHTPLFMDEVQEHAKQQALAALKALRDHGPSEAMVEDGQRCYDDQSGEFDAVFEAMITAAIEEAA